MPPAGLLARLLDSATPPMVFLRPNGHVLATAAKDLLQLGVEISGQVDLAGMDDVGPYDVLPHTAVAISRRGERRCPRPDSHPRGVSGYLRAASATPTNSP
ncbi:hypothetical protein AB0H36_18875 [Kribbella sp. NPDC050820]|uniref:hypothetical protein n=1 Tax=Kribbella sp. NPDC050820 TaxID=3155408 RepID=UPI0033DD6C8C